MPKIEKICSSGNCPTRCGEVDRVLYFIDVVSSVKRITAGLYVRYPNGRNEWLFGEMVINPSDSGSGFNIPCEKYENADISVIAGGVLVRGLFVADPECVNNGVNDSTVDVFFRDGEVSLWQEEPDEGNTASRVLCCQWEEKDEFGNWEDEFGNPFKVVYEMPCLELGLTILDPNDPEEEILNPVYADFVRNVETVTCGTGLEEAAEQI